MGDWSTVIILSSRFTPRRTSCLPDLSFEPLRMFDSTGNSVSVTSVDFPEPDTPVTHVRTPTGNPAYTLLRLFSDAPTSSTVPLGFLLADGVGMDLRPAR